MSLRDDIIAIAKSNKEWNKYVMTMANRQIHIQGGFSTACAILATLGMDTPQSVYEFSCGTGNSTCTIANALRFLKKKTILHTMDKDPASVKEAMAQVYEKGLGDFVSFSIANVMKYPFPDEIDWLMIDSAHSEEMAKWYVANVFPKVKSGGIIWIHDLIIQNDQIFPAYYDAGGEYSVVDKYLRSNQIDFFATHSMLHDKELTKIVCPHDYMSNSYHHHSFPAHIVFRKP